MSPLARLSVLVAVCLVAAVAPSAASAAITFEAGTGTSVDTHGIDQAAGDVDGDGVLDVVFGHFGTADGIAFLKGAGDGTFTNVSDYTSVPGGDVALGDMDGDGDLDLVSARNEASNAQLRISLGDGTGSFAPQSSVTIGANPASLTLSDVNGDGALDALVGTGYAIGGFFASPQVYRALGNGAGGFGSPAAFGASTTPIDLGARDVDGDGDRDVVAAGTGSYPWLLRNNGSGSFGSESIALGSFQESRYVDLGDLDGDGDPDLAFTNANSNAFTVAFNTGSGTFSDAVTRTGIGFPTGIAIEDLDGDGDADVAVQGRFSSAHGVRSYANDGAGVLTAASTLTLPLSVPLNEDIIVRDVNGGLPDVLTIRSNPNAGLLPLLNITPPNAAPTVTGVTITPPTVRTDSTLTATPSGTDPEGSSLTYAYQWQKQADGDSSFSDIASATSSTLNLATAGNGDKGDQLRVVVTANDGSRTSAPFTSSAVTVGDSTPQVSTGSGTYSGAEGSPIALAGTATDADGDPLTLAWSAEPGSGVDPGATCSFGDAAAAATSVVCTDDGTFTVKLTASDGAGTPSWATQAMTVTNAAPQVGAIALTGASAPACLGGNQVGASFGVSDPGANDTLGGSVDWGDGSAATPFTGHAFSGSHTYSAGTYAITASAQDDDGGSDSRSTTAGAVSLLYDRSDFGTPINASGTRSTFKLGSTIPLKVAVTDCDGRTVSTLGPRVGLEKVDGTTTAPVNEVVSSSAADSGSTMRFDGTRYAYNLSTKRTELTPGSYRLTVTDPAIEPLSVVIDLRK